ncbi:uncharacterized protein LOC132716173 [Ruditapes philippinarum]|uniref:uncharacterized protein LOC132716173 n=1 Tax=Ruditapes philippinarum TaxID=129788 RepID=UPI00295B2FBB|nr:uncharacterized protein LOC132716173 [Ruditapes philippinarum]
MLLTVNSGYKLTVDDYRDQGAKITMTKKKGLKQIVCILVILVSYFATFVKLKATDISKIQFYVGIIMTIAALLYIIYQLRRVYSESLLIIASIGVTVQQSCLLGTSSTFYELRQIQDIVIIEAVTMSNIIFQLVILPKQNDHTCLIPEADNTTNSKQRLHPLFQCFRPKLKDLQTIYRHTQEKLILPSHVHSLDNR